MLAREQNTTRKFNYALRITNYELIQLHTPHFFLLPSYFFLRLGCLRHQRPLPEEITAPQVLAYWKPASITASSLSLRRP